MSWLVLWYVRDRLEWFEENCESTSMKWTTAIEY